jgi:hypothetical protein
MIIAGLVLMLIGLLTGLALFWTVGIVVAIIGLVFLLLGQTGHGIGGRHHYW